MEHRQGAPEFGADVSVICPMFGKDSEKETVLDDIAIYRYKNTFADGSVAGYVKEYGTAFVKTFFLLHKLLLRRKRIHIVHVANPPDIFWPLALYVRLFGIKFIFDEHDLSPEAYLSRFDKAEGTVDCLFTVQSGSNISHTGSRTALSPPTNHTRQEPLT